MKIWLFKIKEGQLETWKGWCHLLMTKFKDEAMETLKEEGVTYQSCIIFALDGQYYAMAMVEGDIKPTNMNRELNQKHRAMKKECLQKIDSVKMGYELYATPRVN